MSASSQKTRRDPRRGAAEDALIECAERLFAQHGIESVSLRQIGAAAGSANNGVVAYYFGTKDALVRAIYRHRLPALDARRAELLAEAEATGLECDVRTLLRVLCQPLLELTDAEGRHSYAGFLASVSRSRQLDVRDALEDARVTRDVIARIERLIPAQARDRYSARLQISIGMITNVLSIIDQNIETCSRDYVRALFDDAISMLTTAIAAPAR